MILFLNQTPADRNDQLVDRFFCTENSIPDNGAKNKQIACTGKINTTIVRN